MGTGSAILYWQQVQTYLKFTIYESVFHYALYFPVWTTGYPIQEIEFPSITICSQGTINEIIGDFKKGMTLEGIPKMQGILMFEIRQVG